MDFGNGSNGQSLFDQQASSSLLIFRLDLVQSSAFRQGVAGVRANACRGSVSRAVRTSSSGAYC